MDAPSVEMGGKLTQENILRFEEVNSEKETTKWVRQIVQNMVQAAITVGGVWKTTDSIFRIKSFA